MVQEYNINNDIENIYNEVFEIILKKKKILSNHKTKVYNFTKNNLIKILFILLFGFTISDILEINNISNEIIRFWDFFIVIFSFVLLYNQMIFIKTLNDLKNNNSSSKIIIDKENIIDISNDIEIKIKLEKITHIIVGKYSVNVLAEQNSFHIFFPIEIKNKIINSIKKYKKDIEIIELKND